MQVIRAEVRDCWSFSGPEWTVLDGFGRVNVIIGKNNTGKSNVLRLLRRLITDGPSAFANNTGIRLAGGDRYNPGLDERPVSPAFKFTLSFDRSDKAMLERTWVKDVARRSVIETWTRSNVTVTFEFAFGPEGQLETRKGVLDPESEAELQRQHSDWARTDSAARLEVLGSFGAHAATRLAYVGGWRHPNEPVAGSNNSLYEFLDAMARRGPDDGADYRLYGRIIRRFEALTGLQIRSLLKHQNTASILVESKERRLELKRLGDGITHLLILAVEIEMRCGCVLLIEEPETHLHPELQRRVVRALAENVDNQVIVTTHSPVLLDAGIADRVFATENQGQHTTVRLAVTRNQQFGILDEIGARASDLLQANVVIWVEGPSDRLFINRCIALAGGDGSTPSEGIEYQIVFYGGSNRAHLTAGEEDRALIDVLRLGRRVVMVADSDRSSESEAINATKERLDKAVKEYGGLSWVTHGREIENYIGADVLKRTFEALHLRAAPPFELGRFDQLGEVLAQAIPAPPDGQKWSVDYAGNKVRLMTEFVKRMMPEDLDVFDLKERVRELVDFIRSANSK